MPPCYRVDRRSLPVLALMAQRPHLEENAVFARLQDQFHSQSHLQRRYTTLSFQAWRSNWKVLIDTDSRVWLGTGLIEIGDNVTIASGVRLLTHDGSSRLFRHRPAGSSPWGNRFRRIIIRDNNFIGVGDTVLPDVEIGPNSIVWVGSVVSQDVPPGTVVAGNPARHICTLDEYIEEYQQKMIPISATNRDGLCRELTLKFWSEER